MQNRIKAHRSKKYKDRENTVKGLPASPKIPYQDILQMNFTKTQSNIQSLCYLKSFRIK